MLSYPVILAITTVSLVVVSIVVFLVSGSFSAVIVVLILAGIILYLLNTFGYLTVQTGNKGLTVDFHENVPAPHNHHQKKKKPELHIKEVFYVQGNDYTYNDAAAVCAAYGSELASYDQVMEAFNIGAEWCGYGWSVGGMALFPTQESTWSAMQMEADETKRTACGRPGVNGGYFDPRLKFGVNCYGNKPKNTGMKLPAPLPGTDPSAFDAMVNKFKGMLHSMHVSPFNRDIWSKTGIAQEQATKTKSYLSRVGADIENDIGAIV